MHILLTGGTGLIGRRLCRHWLDLGHQLTVWSRRPDEVPRLCGAGVRGIAHPDDLGAQQVSRLLVQGNPADGAAASRLRQIRPVHVTLRGHARYGRTGPASDR